MVTRSLVWLLMEEQELWPVIAMVPGWSQHIFTFTFSAGRDTDNTTHPPTDPVGRSVGYSRAGRHAFRVNSQFTSSRAYFNHFRLQK